MPDDPDSFVTKADDTATDTPLSDTALPSSSTSCKINATRSPNFAAAALSAKSSETRSFTAGLVTANSTDDDTVSSESKRSPTSPVHAHSVDDAANDSEYSTSPDGPVTRSPNAISQAIEPPTTETSSAEQRPSTPNASPTLTAENTSTTASGIGNKSLSRTDTANPTGSFSSTDGSAACKVNPAGRATVCANIRVMNTAICARVT